MPARARSVGVNAVMSAKLIVPRLGTSAPARHFTSVLLPEPFGPIRPRNSLSPTVTAALSSAVSLPKSFEDDEPKVDLAPHQPFSELTRCTSAS